jgi:hypothetical protein
MSPGTSFRRLHQRRRLDAQSGGDASACRIRSRAAVNVFFRTVAFDGVIATATLLLLCLGVSDNAVAAAAEASPPAFPQQQQHHGQATTTPASTAGKCIQGFR